MTSIEIYLTKNANGPLNTRPAKNGQPGNGNGFPPMPLLNPQGEGRGWGALGRNLYNGLVKRPLEYWGKNNIVRGVGEALYDTGSAIAEIPSYAVRADKAFQNYMMNHHKANNGYNIRQLARDGADTYHDMLNTSQNYLGSLDRRRFGGYLKPIARTGLGIVGELATAPLGAARALSWGSKAIRGGLSAANAARAGAGLGLGTLYGDVGGSLGTAFFDHLAGDSPNGYSVKKPTPRAVNGQPVNTISGLAHNAVLPTAAGVGAVLGPKLFNTASRSVHNLGNTVSSLPVSQKDFNQALTTLADRRRIPLVVTSVPNRDGSFSTTQLNAYNGLASSLQAQALADGNIDAYNATVSSKRFNWDNPAAHINMLGTSPALGAHENMHNTFRRLLRKDLRDPALAKSTAGRKTYPSTYDTNLRKIRGEGALELSQNASWANRIKALGRNFQDTPRGRSLQSLGRFQAMLQPRLGIDPNSPTGVGLNLAFPLLAHAPQLLEEAGASYKGMKYAPEITKILGQKQPRWRRGMGALGLAGAFGTYLAKPLLGGAVNQAIANVSDAYNGAIDYGTGWLVDGVGNKVDDWIKE